MKDKENRNSVEFDRLHEKDYSDRLIFGRSTLTEFEKSFISDSVDHNLEYIGAPGGGEDNSAKATYIEYSYPRYRYGIDYPDDGIRSRQVINIDEEYKKQFQKELIAFEDFCSRSNSSHYSNLSNININKGQGDMFSYTNNNPAAGSKPSDDFKAFEKLTNKLVNKSKTYRPLPDCLTIKESSIDGLGLFAVEDIDKDVTLGVTHHYIDVGFKDELIRTPLAGFLNHSDNPNVTIEEFENGKGIGHTYKNYKLITLRPISLGEEIVVDYTKELCGLIGYDGAEFLKEY